MLIAQVFNHPNDKPVWCFPQAIYHIHHVWYVVQRIVLYNSKIINNKFSVLFEYKRKVLGIIPIEFLFDFVIIKFLMVTKRCAVLKKYPTKLFDVWVLRFTLYFRIITKLIIF